MVLGLKKESSTQEIEKISDGDNWSLILQLSFPGWGCDTLGNLQGSGKSMFGHRREGDGDQGGLGSLAVHGW